MLGKIYKELAAIRKELQTISKNLDLGNRMIVIRRPYGAREELVTVKEGLRILEKLEPKGGHALSCRPYSDSYKSGTGTRKGK